MLLLDGSSSMIETRETVLANGRLEKKAVGDGLGVWNKEKQAATQLISALSRKLKNFRSGVVQFSGFPGNDKPQDSLLFPKPAGLSAIPQNCTALGWGTNGIPKTTANITDCVEKHGSSCYRQTTKYMATLINGTDYCCSSSRVATPYCPGQYALTQVRLSSDSASVEQGIDGLALMKGGTDFASPLSLCHMEISSKATRAADAKKFCVMIADGAPDETIDARKSAECLFF